MDGLGIRKMHRAGFRQLDFQLQEEFFGTVPPASVPSYSGERNAAERIVRHMQKLHPGWRQEIAEDHWGYTVTWLCPWPPGSGREVLVGEHRSPVLPAALCRAALNAHRNFERYEQRRIRRKGREAAPEPTAASRQSS